jgi:hypothetical protein
LPRIWIQREAVVGGRAGGGGKARRSCRWCETADGGVVEVMI